jgi:hypothetical protein
LGLNLASLALLVALLVAGGEAGGLGARWRLWVVPFAVTAAVGTLAFRFPRSVGLPLVVLGAAVGWGTVKALDGFSPLGAVAPVVQAQPLTDRELVTAFAVRVDWIDVPPLPLAPRVLYRLRTTSAPPSEWWWPWVASRGWAKSTGAPLPANPLKFGVYRLALANGDPSWKLVAPELTVPEP